MRSHQVVRLADRSAHRSGLVRGMLLAAASFAAVGAGGSALAQDVRGEQVSGLDDIVVTARKRQESAQNIPVSVTALSAERVSQYDLSNLEKVASTVPQLSIARASNGSGAQIVLRGIGSTFTSVGIEQSVATVVDGVYYGQGRIINEAFFDVGQIEILKGPQALFFGKNSTAGVISVSTANPTRDFEAMVRAGYEFNSHEVFGEAVVSGPVTDTLSMRLAVRGAKMWRGHVENMASSSSDTRYDVATGTLNTYAAPPADRWGPKERQLLGRLTMLWEPTSSFKATIKASGNIDRVANPAWNYITFSCNGGVTTFNPNQPCERKFRNYMNNIPQEMAETLPYANDDGSLSNRYNSWGTTATLEYTADDVTVTSVSNFNRNTNTFVIDGDYYSSPLSNTWATERTHFRAFSSELRALTTYDGPLNLLVGAYYQHTKLNLLQYASLFGVEDSSAGANRYVGWIKDSGTTDKTVAVYGQAIWEIVPQLELTAGVRYSHETKKSRFNQPFINAAMQGLFVTDQPFRANQTFNNWSPDITLTWKPQDNITVYGAYKTGFKSGGFSNSGIHSVAGSINDFMFAPEKAEGFEGGVKTTLFDRQLRLDLGIYSYTFNNLQIDFFNSTTVSFITTNAGSATTKGVELEFQYAPRALPGFSLRGSGNYNDAKYQDYFAPCFGGQTRAEGCTMVRNGVPYQNLAGKPTTNAPKWSASLGAAYETLVGGDLMLGLTADAKYSDNYLASSFGNTTAHQPAYVSLDASIRLKTESARWELALIGRNLTNRFVLNGSQDTVGTGGGTGTDAGVRADVYGLIGFPRTIQLQATWRY